MSTITLKVSWRYRPLLQGYCVRVEQLPVYTYVEHWEDLDRQLNEALELFSRGFPDTDALLRYLRANQVEYSVDGVGVEQHPANVWTPAQDEIECLVNVA